MIVKLVMNYEQLLEIQRSSDLVILLVETADPKIRGQGPIGEVCVAHVKQTSDKSQVDEVRASHKVRLRCDNLGKLILQEIKP